jgi:hypothetical protein
MMRRSACGGGPTSSRRLGAMKRIICGALEVAAVFIPLAVLGASARLGGPLVDGSVARARGCGSHFFIAYHEGFALADWLGGEMVKENDVLQTTDDVSSFEREGRMTLTNLATNRTVDIVIDKALLNHAEYLRTVQRVCR